MSGFGSAVPDLIHWILASMTINSTWNNTPGTWNHNVLAKLRVAYMIELHNFRPSSYRWNDDVVRYDITKANKVPILYDEPIHKSIQRHDSGPRIYVHSEEYGVYFQFMSLHIKDYNECGPSCKEDKNMPTTKKCCSKQAVQELSSSS